MIQRDHEATAKARFEDEKSYIAKDGREVLFGLDWKSRKGELWTRCLGYCEQLTPRSYHNSLSVYLDRCVAEAIDPHHLVRRSEKRDDRLANLKALCRFHHDLLHPEKQPKWTRRGEADAKVS